jgi:nitrite reductase/ring-hydroxylating ferredoxin subunit
MTSQSNWIPVSGSSDLAVASARAVVLPDHDVVIWRTKTGAVHAWENRCPHRGMRLSFGQVRNERLVCRYHGWGFDEGGQCQSIPATPKAAAPPTACAKTWSCAEVGSLIWVDVSDEATAADPVLTGDANAASALLFCKSIYLDGDLEKLLAKLGSARFLPFGYAGDAKDLSWAMSDQAAGVVQISVSGAASDQITITGHQARDGRCGLHIVTSSTSDQTIDQQRRLHYSRWAKRLRWSLLNRHALEDGFPVFA